MHANISPQAYLPALERKKQLQVFRWCFLAVLFFFFKALLVTFLFSFIYNLESLLLHESSSSFSHSLNCS